LRMRMKTTNWEFKVFKKSYLSAYPPTNGPTNVPNDKGSGYFMLQSAPNACTCCFGQFALRVSFVFPHLPRNRLASGSGSWRPSVGLGKRQIDVSCANSHVNCFHIPYLNHHRYTESKMCI
jgi:hypothetical protein